MRYIVQMRDSISEMRDVAMRAKDALCDFCEALERSEFERDYNERHDYGERHDRRYDERYDERYSERSPRYREGEYRGGRYRY